MRRRPRGSIPDQLDWEGRLVDAAVEAERRGDPVGYLMAARFWLDSGDRTSDARWRAFCLASYGYCLEYAGF